MKLRSLSAVLSLGILTALLGGCAAMPPRGVSIPPGAELLDPCTPRTFEVADLVAEGEPGCDLVGSSVHLPDGSWLGIREVGAVFSQQVGTDAAEQRVVNWGVPGVGVSVVRDGVLVDLWASSAQAEQLHRQGLRLEGVAVDE